MSRAKVVGMQWCMREPQRRAGGQVRGQDGYVGQRSGVLQVGTMVDMSSGRAGKVVEVKPGPSQQRRACKEYNGYMYGTPSMAIATSRKPGIPRAEELSWPAFSLQLCGPLLWDRPSRAMQGTPRRRLLDWSRENHLIFSAPHHLALASSPITEASLSAPGPPRPLQCPPAQRKQSRRPLPPLHHLSTPLPRFDMTIIAAASSSSC